MFLYFYVFFMILRRTLRDLHVRTPAFPTRRSSCLARFGLGRVVIAERSIELTHGLDRPAHQVGVMHVDDTLLAELVAKIHDAIGVLDGLPRTVLTEPSGIDAAHERVVRQRQQTDRKSTRLNSSH